jgi:hypothetical protein
MILQSGKLPPQIKPLLRQPRRNGQDQFLFTLGGEPGRVYVVQSSEDLIHWMDFMTGVSGEALPISPSKTAQFYRALPRNE